jgi:hypothetical protein
MALLVYIWAGLTTASALWFINTLGNHLSRVSADIGIKNFEFTAFAFASIAVLWPLVLPVWIAAAINSSRKL